MNNSRPETHETAYDTRTPAAETVSLTALAALPAKLFVVELLDRLHRGLELVPVDADHDELAASCWRSCACPSRSLAVRCACAVAGGRRVNNIHAT